MISSDRPLDIYLRLSDLRDDDLNEAGESEAFVFAERKLRKFVTQLGGVVGKVIVENDMRGGKPKPASAWKKRKILLPNGKTEKRVIRPKFRELLDRIETRKSGGFVAVDLDRVVRDQRDLADLAEVVAEREANVRSMTGSLQFTDGGTAAEQQMAEIMCSTAKKSSADTSRRVSAARERQATNSQYGGGPRPFGFERNGLTHRASEIAEIKRWATDVLAGVSLRSIVADLRQREVPTVTGKQWATGTVRDILLRPRNVARTVHKGVEMSDAPWEPVLDVSVWRAVVAKLTDPNRSTTPGPAPRWLGSGLYLCSCGRPMFAAWASISTKYRTTRYGCKRVAGSGQHVMRQTELLDGIVKELVWGRLSRRDAADLLSTPTDEPGIDLSALNARKGELREEKNALAALKVKKIIDMEQLIAGTREADAELEGIEAILARHMVEDSPLKGAPLGHPIAEVQAYWENLPLGRQRAIIAYLMVVTVKRVGPGSSQRKLTGEDHVDIRWLR